MPTITCEHYPSAAEVDAWCEDRLARADATDVEAEFLDVELVPGAAHARHTTGVHVRFRPVGGEPFWGYWQPAHSGGPAPLAVHLPGYGAEISAHPTICEAGFNVLHVNPRGYCTPEGFNLGKQVDGAWPVLPQTVASLGEHGYVDWYADALVAVRWALGRPSVLPERLGLFGTSQGGGTALILASLLRERNVRAVAADVPFLTNFPLVESMDRPEGAYDLAFGALSGVEGDRRPEAWRALGFADTISHAHRLTMPTLLTAGGEDEVCPPASIRSLFERLPGTRSYTELAGQGHAYTVAFLSLARAWLSLYV